MPSLGPKLSQFGPFSSYYIKQVKTKKSSFIQVILSLAIYSSSCNSSSLTQAWNQVAAIVHFYPSLKSSSGNLGPTVLISSQAQATCWCMDCRGQLIIKGITVGD